MSVFGIHPYRPNLTPCSGMKKTLIFAVLCFAAFGTSFVSAQFGGRGNDEETVEYPEAWQFPKNPRAQVQAEERVNALKRFSLELYKDLSGNEGKKNQNLVCSPWNVALVLTMLFDGAEAQTAKEIRNVLHFPDNSRFFEKYLHMVAFNTRAKERNYGNFRLGVVEEAPLILKTANSFWCQENYLFRDEYTELLSKRFRMESFSVDFAKAPAEAVKEINDWCAKNTDDEIKSIVTESDMNSLRRMVIASAVYFRARWANVFSRTATKPEWFHHADGTVSKTAMMNMKETYGGYYEGNGFKAFRKNYCGNAHMLMILPDEVDGLADLEQKLAPPTLRMIDNRLETVLINVKLPRFSFDAGLNLIPTLRNLGIDAAFDPKKAELKKMTEEKEFYIDFFRQKAVIKVDEEGTVASAVSGAGGMGGGMPKIYTFYADRPFLFLIRENTDNSILFMGRVHQPEKAATGNEGSDL